MHVDRWVFLQSDRVEERRAVRNIRGARLEANEIRLSVWRHGCLNFVQIRFAGLPVIWIAFQRDMVALHPLDQHERSCAADRLARV